MQKTLITEDGNYKIAKNINANSIVVYVAGAFGTAALALQVPDGSGGKVALENGAISSTNSQTEIHTGAGIDLYLDITGADGATNLVIQTASKT